MRVQILTYNGHLTGLKSTDSLGQWLKPTLDKATTLRSTKTKTKAKDGARKRRNKGRRDDDESSDEDDEDVQEEDDDDDGVPDFVAIGFQEMIPLHLALLGLSKTALDAHDSRLNSALSQHYSTSSSSSSYVLLAKKCLGAIALLVYVRRDKLDNVRDIRVASAACGIAGVMGNKGGVGVRVVVNDDNKDKDDEGDARPDPRSRGRHVLTFVTAHLAAHDKGLERRNRDYQTLVERLVFAHDSTSQTYKPVRPLNVFRDRQRGGSSQEQVCQLYDTSSLFVFGDLNYRLSLKKPKSLPLPSLTHKIQNSDFETLFLHDTLTQERRRGATLHSLREGSIDFKPTYKYKVGTADTYKSFKKRVPGWTDRVVFATWTDNDGDRQRGEEQDIVKVGQQEERGELVVEAYTSVQDFTQSDHKPVTAVIKLPSTRLLAKSSSSELSALRLRAKNPYKVDPTWRRKKLFGWVLDRIVGLNWCLLVLLGFNKDARLGIVNLALITFALYHRA
ncbi:hypothetical protein ACM66B_004872 [Microbotryomycetes sp. NB124-2]